MIRKRTINKLDSDDKNNKNSKNPKKKDKKQRPTKKRKTEVIQINNKEDLDNFFNILMGGGPENFDQIKPALEYESDGYEDCEGDEEEEVLRILNKEKVTIDDLIEWGNLYHKRKRKRCSGINLKTLWRIQAPLKKLQELIGMKSVKDNIVKQIIYYLQHLENGQDMLHTIIEGPPGVGKTELGKILGELYVKLGILENPDINIDDPNFDINKIFKVVKRSDLIGKYLGHTAVKTQEVIDSCKGGVMFIDEAYSLGNKEQRDIFSKECIDCINRNLSEQKANFLCIIAGYPGDMQKCFFAYNDGLKRRFPFKYTIDKYEPEELRDIFKLKVNKLGWTFRDENFVPLEFFKENMKAFPHFGGDMETLLLNCKIHHGMRVFGKRLDEKKILTFDDVKGGFTAYIRVRNGKNEEWKRNHSLRMMYL